MKQKETVDKKSTVGICYIAKTRLTKESLLQRFGETVTDGEIESLVFIDDTYEAMSNLLMQQSLVDYAKVILGTRLHGRSFGDIREYDFE